MFHSISGCFSRKKRIFSHFHKFRTLDPHPPIVWDFFLKKIDFFWMPSLMVNGRLFVKSAACRCILAPFCDTRRLCMRMIRSPPWNLSVPLRVTFLVRAPITLSSTWSRITNNVCWMPHVARLVMIWSRGLWKHMLDLAEQSFYVMIALLPSLQSHFW